MNSTTPTNTTLWEKIKSFGSRLMGPDVNREDTSASITPSSPTSADTSTAGEKLDKFTTIVGTKVDEAKSTVSDMTTRASTKVSDLFGTPEDGDTYQPTPQNQTGGKSRRIRRRTAARSTVRANISKKITKIVDMMKKRMTCKNKHRRNKKSK